MAKAPQRSAGESAYLAPDTPRIFGHRGAAAVAPENTHASFAVAAALGADYLELDVHATKDGVVVVFHDDLLDCTTNGSGPLKELSWNDLQQLDAGYRFTSDGSIFPFRGQGVQVPTLDSVLRSFPNHRFNIEIKQREPAIVDQTIEILRSANAASRSLLAAAEDSIMSEIRSAVDETIVTGSSEGDVLAFFTNLADGTLDSYTPPGVALQIPPSFGERELVTDESIRAAHDSGLEIHVWTINEAAEIDRLLDLGVDGIMSDAPGLITTAIARRQS